MYWAYEPKAGKTQGSFCGYCAKVWVGRYKTVKNWSLSTLVAQCGASTETKDKVRALTNLSVRHVGFLGGGLAGAGEAQDSAAGFGGGSGKSCLHVFSSAKRTNKLKNAGRIAQAVSDAPPPLYSLFIA
jgi:hypothetical protein